MARLQSWMPHPVKQRRQAVATTVLAPAALSVAALASRRDVPWASARELARAAPNPLPARHIPLTQAAGLTLADVLHTPQPMPGFDTAAMDGYAVGPGIGPWRVRGAVRAGGAWTGGPLDTGDTVAISTGAPVPAGARAVVPLEQTERTGALVCGPAPADGKHIRRTGEDAPVGAFLTAAHTLLAPLLAGLTGRTLPALPRIPLTGDIRTTPGRTRLIPVTWDGATARPVGGHRPAFLHGAALADALAAVAADRRPGQPVPLILLTG
ncbi:hypothetical protein [Streptomyces sp. LN245]|uniref:hypothetical protein n=1 Tax=Streptomyces sp. LN245 TaxID=3112975 RepID=UPI00371745D7